MVFYKAFKDDKLNKVIKVISNEFVQKEAYKRRYKKKEAEIRQLKNKGRLC